MVVVQGGERGLVWELDLEHVRIAVKSTSRVGGRRLSVGDDYHDVL